MTKLNALRVSATIIRYNKHNTISCRYLPFVLWFFIDEKLCLRYAVKANNCHRVKTIPLCEARILILNRFSRL
jgi:hypothetical protein